MNILVTGATGFVGRSLLKVLSGLKVTSLVRKDLENKDNIIKADLEDFNKKIVIESKFEVVVHLAALVHSKSESNDYIRINHDATLALATQCAEAGMKRFIFLSSINVNNSHTAKGSKINEISHLTPHSEYAVSKYRAELALKKLSKKLNFELIIIRPPLIYGVDAPGNFGLLINLIKKGYPLPFGLIKNKRSYISLSNLVDFISICIHHPNAANETFVIADDEYLSTTEMLELISQKYKKILLIPIPVMILRLLFIIIGKKGLSVQLLDDLQIDNSKAKQLLGWTASDRFSNLNF